MGGARGQAARGIEIGRRKVRGALSDGMLASARELGVFDDHSGILVLPPDTPVGVDVVEAVDLRDSVLDVKTAPNRGDILSMRGIAREVAVAFGKELKPLDLTVPEAGPPAETLATVAVEDTEGCPVRRPVIQGRTAPAHPVDGQAAVPVASGRSGRSSTSPTTCCWTRASRCTPSTST